MSRWEHVTQINIRLPVQLSVDDQVILCGLSAFDIDHPFVSQKGCHRLGRHAESSATKPIRAVRRCGTSPNQGHSDCQLTEALRAPYAVHRVTRVVLISTISSSTSSAPNIRPNCQETWWKRESA